MCVLVIFCVEIPITDPTVLRPNFSIGGLILLFTSDTNFGRSRSLNFGTEHPNISDLDPLLMKMTTYLVLCRFLFKATDGKLPEITGWWYSFQTKSLIGTTDHWLLFPLSSARGFPLFTFFPQIRHLVCKGWRRWNKRGVRR